MYIGDFPTSAVIDFKWNSQGLDGASITRSTDGSLRIYKTNSVTQRTSAAGITDTEDFDTLTGIHHLRIDTSDNTDAGFYAAGSEYQVVLVAATIDTKVVNTTLAHFSIERAGGALALLKSGTFGLSVLKTETASIQTDTNDLQTRVPAALVSGRIDASVGAMAADVVTAAAIAANAIGASELATDAVAEIADQVWDEVLAGHLTAGTTGAALNGAGSAGDPWVTALPGAYGAGSAGKIVGDFLDQPVSQVSSDVAGVQTDTDNIQATMATAAALTTAQTALTNLQARVPAALVSGRMDSSVGANLDKTGYALTTGDKDDIVDRAWDELIAGHLTAATTGAALNGAGSAGDPWTTPLPGAYGAGTAGKILSDTKVDTTAIAAAVDTEVAAIKVKTDQLTFTTPNVVDASGAGGGGGLTAPQAAQLTAIEGKTAPLPTDPADQSVIMGAIAAIVGAPSAADNATAVWAKVIEQQGSITAQQALSIGLAILTGVTENTGLTIKTPNGVSIRVVGTVNALNERQTITLTPSAP